MKGDLIPIPGASAPNRKYARELLRQLPKGCRVAYAAIEGGGKEGFRKVGTHPYVFGPDGKVLRLNGMPVTAAGTPGDYRSMKNVLSRARRALDG